MEPASPAAHKDISDIKENATLAKITAQPAVISTLAHHASLATTCTTALVLPHAQKPTSPAHKFALLVAQTALHVWIPILALLVQTASCYILELVQVLAQKDISLLMEFAKPAQLIVKPAQALVTALHAKPTDFSFQDYAIPHAQVAISSQTQLASLALLIALPAKTTHHANHVTVVSFYSQQQILAVLELVSALAVLVIIKIPSGV